MPVHVHERAAGEAGGAGKFCQENVQSSALVHRWLPSGNPLLGGSGALFGHSRDGAAGHAFLPPK
jgi:hypothetical protein